MGNYCSATSETTNLVYANSTSTLTSQGNVTQGYLAENSAGTGVGTAINFADYGTADFRCGAMTIGGTTLYGAAVIFPLGASTVDPSIVQSTSNANFSGTSQSCTYNSNVTEGNELIISVGGNFATVAVYSDSESLTWNDYSALYSGYSAYDYIFYAQATSTGPETVTFHLTGNGGDFVDCYEVSGLANSVSAESTGTGSCYLCAPSASVASYTPSSGEFIFASIDELGGGNCYASPLFTAGSGYTYESSTGGCQYYGPVVGDEYDSSASGSATTSPITSDESPGASTAYWAELSLAFAPTVAQPITATLNTVYGGSTQTITVSGCSPSPSSFSGDGASHNIVMTHSCSYSLTLPSGYQWTTGSSSTSCSSGTCSAFSATYERSPATLPITATLRGNGSTQTISVIGCSASPTTFTGDGSSHSITATPLCELTLGLPSGYLWESTGTFEITTNTCSSGTCPSVSPSYMKAVEATLDPPNLVNLTGSSSSVYVNLFNNTYNDLAGSSCSGPPCTPNTGGLSFQFNFVLPNFRVANNTNPYHYCGTSTNNTSTCIPFMVQSTIEFYNNGTCKAVPQGAPMAPPAPKNPVIYSFTCSTITAPAANFKWIVDSSSGFFTDVKLQINGATKETWIPSQIFNMTYWPGSGSVNMTDSYAQSALVGNFSSWKYANIYSGGGFVSYSGAELLHRTHGTLGALKVTGEESNVEYTAIPAVVTSSNQTYDAGVFDSYYVGDSGSVSNGQYIIGPPDGNYAQLEALSSGTTACDVGEFEIGGPPVNGTIAIYGYSASSHSSAVQVSVSASLSTCTSGSWTTVYAGTWSSSTPQWIPVGSVTSIESIKITTSYSGSGASGADIYVDSISTFMGSYAQSLPGRYESSSGVTSASKILEIPDSNYTELQASSVGTSAWINASLGTEYSGELVIYGHTASGYNSTFRIDYSSDGVNWTNACIGNWTSSSEGPLVCGSFGITKALYIRITVSDAGNPADLYIDGLYVA